MRVGLFLIRKKLEPFYSTVRSCGERGFDAFLRKFSLRLHENTENKIRETTADQSGENLFYNLIWINLF